MSLCRILARLTVTAVAVVAVALASLILVPKALGWETYVITSGSMSGLVEPGDLVLARRVPVTQLAVGDVITYLPPASSGVRELVTHRIVDIEPDRSGVVTYRTRGDANSTADPWVFSLERDVQPRMVTAIPLLGRPVMWLAEPGHRVPAVGGPAVLIALVALRDVMRLVRRDRRPVALPRAAS